MKGIQAGITAAPFGKTSEGVPVTLFTLSNSRGTQAGVLDYGGTIQFIRTASKSGLFTDVALGCATMEDYEKNTCYFGALIGRHGNRIRNGRFLLNGKEYSLYCNDGNHHLHGGKAGFDRRMWNASVQGNSLRLTRLSPDGEEGYPGNLLVSVLYTLTEDNALTLEYQALCDADTVCNLTNHVYFNLAGESSGAIENQWIQIASDQVTDADGDLLPNGALLHVKDTPMDLRIPTRIGERIDDEFPLLKSAGGYDHNFVIRDYDGSRKLAARAYDKTTGICLSCRTTLPGLQFYCGNFITPGNRGKNGEEYPRRAGFCLETQFFPNGMEHENFIQPILRAGTLFRSVTSYTFEVLSPEEF